MTFGEFSAAEFAQGLAAADLEKWTRPMPMASRVEFLRQTVGIETDTASKLSACRDKWRVWKHEQNQAN